MRTHSSLSRFSPFPSESKFTDPLKLLDDAQIDNWKDAIDTFGDPQKSPDEANQIPEESNVSTVISPLPKSTQQRQPNRSYSSFQSDKANDMLRRRDFDVKEFVRTIFQNDSLVSIKKACDFYGRTGESNESQQTKIADNFHNYVKAYDDLLDAQEKFRTRTFPGQQDVDDLLEEIHSIIEKMNNFFQVIRVQSIKAQNASALLSRISPHAYIFQLSSEIERYCINSQFDEIARVMQKPNQIPHLKTYPLFSTALNNLEIALANVEKSLQSKLQQMNAKTFKKSYCQLLFDIAKRHDSNPLQSILLSIDQRLRESLKSGDFDETCSALENSLPFWKVLCDFYEEYYSSSPHTPQDLAQYQEYQKNINGLLCKLAKDFDHGLREMLIKIKDKPLPKNSYFNSAFHAAFCRVYKIWNQNTSGSKAFIYDILNELQTWYIQYLKDQCQAILRGPDPGNRLYSFLIEISKAEHILLTHTYRSIILDPIYDFYDNLHEEYLVGDKEDLPNVINSLSQLARKNMNEIFKQYQLRESKSAPLMTEKDIEMLNTTGEELLKLLKNKLMKKFSIDINNAVFRGMFTSYIDWDSDDLQIRPDGWTLYILNRCVQCKCKWGEIFRESIGLIANVAINSVYCSLLRLHHLSPAACARIEMDVMILRRIFDKQSTELWGNIEDRLKVLCPSIPHELKEQQNKVYEDFLSEIRLQLYAYNPSNGYKLQPQRERTTSSTDYSLFPAPLPPLDENEERPNYQSTLPPLPPPPPPTPQSENAGQDQGVYDENDYGYDDEEENEHEKENEEGSQKSDENDSDQSHSSDSDKSLPQDESDKSEPSEKSEKDSVKSEPSEKSDQSEPSEKSDNSENSEKSEKESEKSEKESEKSEKESEKSEKESEKSEKESEKSEQSKDSEPSQKSKKSEKSDEDSDKEKDEDSDEDSDKSEESSSARERREEKRLRLEREEQERKEREEKERLEREEQERKEREEKERLEREEQERKEREEKEKREREEQERKEREEKEKREREEQERKEREEKKKKKKHRSTKEEDSAAKDDDDVGKKEEKKKKHRSTKEEDSTPKDDEDVEKKEEKKKKHRSTKDEDSTPKDDDDVEKKEEKKKRKKREHRSSSAAPDEAETPSEVAPVADVKDTPSEEAPKEEKKKKKKKDTNEESSKVDEDSKAEGESKAEDTKDDEAGEKEDGKKRKHHKSKDKKKKKSSNADADE